MAVSQPYIMEMLKKSHPIHNKGTYQTVKTLKFHAVKKALTIIILLFLAAASFSSAQAQGRKVIYLHNYNNEPYHFGFLLGVNFIDYSMGLKDDYQNKLIADSLFPKPSYLNGLNSFSEDSFVGYQILNVESRKMTRNPGFSVGVIGDLRLSEFFNFRFIPTLSLSWRRVYYSVALYNADGEILTNQNGEVTGYKTVQSRDDLATYLEFPMQIKYRSKRYNNIGAYLIGGINPKLYLVSRQNATDDEKDPNYLVPKRLDLALEFGTGFDIYNQWFKMGVEVKMSFGMFNLLKEDELSKNFLYQAPLESLRNKQLQLSFTFE